MRTLLSFVVLLAVGCLCVWGGAAAAATSSDEEEAAKITFPKIDRRPQAEGYSRRGALDELPRGNRGSEWSRDVDLRAHDVSGLDLSDSLHDLLWASFDDKTAWPPDERMPAGFDRERIMELGKDPGLGVRTLHDQGITGRGVGVAIVDQPLLTTHVEYADRLRLYEEINVKPDTEPQMHGPAVASIAVGKTVGVAPEADLYYIAAWPGDWGVGPDGFTMNYTYKARAIRRILEVNKQLPEDRKIRVISISKGWSPGEKAYEDIMAACEEAKAAGMLVVCSSVDDVHGAEFKLLGLGRAPLDDPNAFESCKPWHHVAERIYSGRSKYTDWLMTPSDSRATASPNGDDEYVFYRQGGLSWSIPYAAGVYALAAQVDPKITPERFWSLALKTGRAVELEHDGKKVSMGRVIDPVALIGALQSGTGAAAGPGADAVADAGPPAGAERAPDDESGRIEFPKIDRRPVPEWAVRVLTSLPHYDPESGGAFPVDLRGRDVSGLDLRTSLSDLLYATFDDRTIWPPDDQMPEGFDRARIMELGKSPALGVRKLHAQGITGRGVGVAIIDQPLLVEHQEYADRLRLYEEINIKPRTEPQMHGPAVASIAVGKTLGVAPEADLYYIGTWSGDRGVGPDGFTYNFVYKAQGIRRIVEVNKQLPDDRKIRVISISVGWNPKQQGYDEIMAAVAEANAAGILVVCCGPQEVHGFNFYGMGRPPDADPDSFDSCRPSLWQADGFYKREYRGGRLLVPMDSRTTASPSGADEYVFYRKGGYSWAIPYVAGLYALAVQVDPRVTPERFWSLAMKTGKTIELEHDGAKLPLGPIIDPVALIGALQGK